MNPVSGTERCVLRMLTSCLQKLQSVPIVRSTHECEQQVNRAGIIAQATCKEEHVFRPFSRDNSGATTQVDYTLTFQKQIKKTSTSMGKLTPSYSRGNLHSDCRDSHQIRVQSSVSGIRKENFNSQSLANETNLASSDNFIRCLKEKRQFFV